VTHFHHQGTDHLRKGRYSLAGTRYFITLCTENRQKGLTSHSIQESITNTLRKLQAANDIDLFCATIMPDHVHLLYRLGSTLSLSQVQGKFKRFTRQTLNQSQINWQPNYYDHRLRADTALESFSRYIFLNPYRKQLITCEATWPGWRLNRNYEPEFLTNLESGITPPNAWLAGNCSNESLSQLINQDLKE
jgi:REP element-mobilizing transposase RayT